MGPLPVYPKSGRLHLRAEEVANALSQIFSHFGFLEDILSDQGTEFTSATHATLRVSVWHYTDLL